jgi:hypothetical protein
MDKDATSLIFSTYFGFAEKDWNDEYDSLNDIGVDDMGRIIFCGITDDPNFPITQGVYNSNFVQNMGYLGMFYPNGTALEFCTFLFPKMIPERIAIGGYQDIFVAGNFFEDKLIPTTDAIDNTFAGQREAFLFDMDFNGTLLKYATYLGGSRIEVINDLECIDNNVIYIAGYTDSIDLMMSDPSLQSANCGGDDGFVIILRNKGTVLDFSSYLGGGQNDIICDVESLSDNEIYIAGETRSTDFPISSEAYDDTFNIYAENIFISRIKINSLLPSVPESIDLWEGNRYVNLSWQSPYDMGNSEIIGYNIYRSKNVLDFELLPRNEPLSLWYNDTNLVNGKEYRYKISAVNTVGEGPQSESIIGTPGTIPDPPSITSYTIGSKYVNISWNQIPYDGGRTVSGYNGYFGIDKNDLEKIELPGDTFFCNFTNLNNGYLYHFGISSINAMGEGRISDILSFTPMGVSSSPGQLKLSIGKGYAILDWNVPTDYGGDQDISYNVYGSEDETIFVRLVTGLEECSYNISPFEEGKRMAFKVTANNSVGESVPSNVVFSYGLPTCPRDLSVETFNRAAILRWSHPFLTGGSEWVKYRVYSGLRPDRLDLIAEDIEDTGYTITDLVNGKTYYLAVSALNPNGEGPISDVMEGTPFGVPSAPINLRGIRDDEEVTLIWGVPEDWGGHLSLEYAVFSGTDPDSLGEVGKSSTTEFIVEGLQKGETYSFTVRAINAEGAGEFSNRIEVNVTSVPGIPVILTAIPGDRKVDLTWEWPTDDGGSSIMGYEVAFSQKDRVGETEIAVGPESNYSLRGLTNGAIYSIKIRAVNAKGPGPFSDTLETIPSGLPSSPSSLSCYYEEGSVRIAWTEPMDDGGSEIIGYKIYRGNSPDQLELLANEGPVDLEYSDEWVSDDRTYYYRVNAINKNGEGTGSSVVSLKVIGSGDESKISISMIIAISIIAFFVLVGFAVAYRARESKQLPVAIPTNVAESGEVSEPVPNQIAGSTVKVTENNGGE